MLTNDNMRENGRQDYIRFHKVHERRQQRNGLNIELVEGHTPFLGIDTGRNLALSDGIT